MIILVPGPSLPKHRPPHHFNERDDHILSSTDVLAQDRHRQHQGDGAQTDDVLRGFRGTYGREKHATQESGVWGVGWG